MTHLHIIVNGEARTTPEGSSVAGLIDGMGIDRARVAIERNQDVVPRRLWTEALLAEGDKIEIVSFVGGGSGDADLLCIAGRTFSSRLLVGTGKYRSNEETRRAIDASGAAIVTVALRRIDLTSGASNVLDALDRARHVLLPNTAGCYTAEEAVRTCRLARELGMGDMVKLEVIADTETLLPDGVATLEAAKILIQENFVVLPYCLDDPPLCKKLEDIGCQAVMPLAAPIGSGLGICNPTNLSIIIARAKVPVIVDAGVGTASDAAVAMELGCDGVLMNTAIAGAKDPVTMAHAMRQAVGAGRQAFRAGRIPRKIYASASSPTTGLIE
jgi:thiazole synthase